MSMVNIFTRYKQEENHLTNGLISILSMSRLDNPNFLTSFLRDVLGLSPNGEIDTFRVLGGLQGGTWDGEVCGEDFCILFETKIVSGTLRREQIRSHLQRLKHRSERLRKLVLLTPDDSNSSYISKYQSLDADRIVHLGWKRVYVFLEHSVTSATPVFSELVRQFLRRIRDMVFEQDIAGVILKIYFGDNSGVYEDRYLAEMRSGVWSRWNTPREYKSLDGTGRKLLLYDRRRQGITAEVEIEKVRRTNAELDYPWTNLFAPSTLRFFEPPIPLSCIRRVAGFESFGVYRKDRSPYRNITHEQYRELTGQGSAAGIGRTSG